MHTLNEGKLDHLFGSSILNATQGGIAMDHAIKIDELEMNLSDHFGWETSFEIKP